MQGITGNEVRHTIAARCLPYMPDWTLCTDETPAPAPESSLTLKRRTYDMARRYPLLLSIITRVVVSLSLVIVAFMIAMALFRTRELPARTDVTQAVTRVQVMEARPVAVRRQWEGFGTARAMTTAAVPAQVRGIVIEVPKNIVAGAAVKQGQLLARIDDADIRQESEIARERLNDIQSQMAQLAIEEDMWRQRLELLREEVAIAQRDLDRVLAARDAVGANEREVDLFRQALMNVRRNEINAVEQLERVAPRRAQLAAAAAQQQAALHIALRNLERTEIVSPFDGVLQSVDIERGESVNIDQRIARVVSLRKIEVPIRVPASARRFLGEGAEVTLSPAMTNPAFSPQNLNEDLSASQWSARVARVAPEDDPATRTVTVFVEMEQEPTNDPARIIAPGQFMRGTVNALTAEQRWIVPRRAIQGSPGGRIRLVQGGAAVSVAVDVVYQVRGTWPELGIADTLWAVLRDPLPADAKVVLEASRILPEGARVEAVVRDSP